MLGESGDEAADDAITPLLRSDPDLWVRVDAAHSLASLAGARTTTLLLEKAASGDASLARVAALDAPEHRKDPDAVPGLIDLWRISPSSDDGLAHMARGRRSSRSVAPACLSSCGLSATPLRQCASSRSRSSAR